MAKRILRVVKWLGMTPALGVCAFCNREFRVPMTELKRTSDAQQSMQTMFDRHKCVEAGSSPEESQK
jgi:hypothetical protein